MATDLRLAYADIDEALFDVNQIPMTSRDVRSVGEMLFDVDYLARQLLNHAILCVGLCRRAVLEQALLQGKQTLVQLLLGYHRR